MHRLTVLLVMALLVFCQPSAASLGHDFPVVLDQGDGRIDISRHLTYYEDPSGEMNISTILSEWPEIASSGQPSKAYNFGFTDSVYWFHTRIENRSSTNHRWVIEGLYPIIDEMEVFFVPESGGVGRQIAGDSVPFVSRPRDHHNINFYLELPKGESVDVFFRVRTSGAVQMRLLLWNSASLSARPSLKRPTGSWLP